MSIEMHEPQINALIQQRMATGAFHNVEEVLLYALETPANRNPRRDVRKGAGPVDRQRSEHTVQQRLLYAVASARPSCATRPTSPILWKSLSRGSCLRRDPSPNKPNHFHPKETWHFYPLQLGRIELKDR
jgi:hypothetical protein